MARLQRRLERPLSDDLLRGLGIPWLERGFFCNEEVDELLAEAKDASTLESYEEVLDKVQTIITKDDVPVIAVAQPKWPTVLQSNIETCETQSRFQAALAAA